jgi:hypothetical protein
MLGLSAVGCGRVGVHLLPLAVASHPPDSGTLYSGMHDADVGDAGPINDAASSDAGGTTGADACVASSADGAAACSCNEGSYVPDAACGVGYCRSTNTASSCVAGVEIACQAGSPRSASDATCDGVDDNCNGVSDEDYAVAHCGVGYCRSTSVASRCDAGIETLCTPGAPLSSDDATPDGVDDDCDGQTDEDACIPRTDIYRAGSFSLSPPANCTTLTVKLWGGGGASGDAQAGYWLNVTGGNGGAGGYASSVITVTASSLLQLYVGGGGKGCGMPGAGGISAHDGGTGGTGTAQAGTRGADGSRTGGSGGNSSSGGDGGRGSLGGGGGGAGTDPGFAPHGGGGGGGAATALIVGSTSVIAGGGGGGGGAGSDLTTAGHSGGHAGAGCSGNGLVATTQGGGGGGGGICQGATTQMGSGRMPYDASSELSSTAALGGSSARDCDPGGDGYAIVSFSR